MSPLRPLRVVILLLIAMLAVAAPRLVSSWTSGVIEAKAWVVPHVTTVRAPNNRDVVNRIIARVGALELTVYEAMPGDLEFGRPVVSRDGTRLAFAKVDDDGTRLHYTIYSINVDGTGMKPVLELTPPVTATRGTIIGGLQLSWSPDNRSLAIFGLPLRGPTSTPLGGTPLRRLATVDLATGTVTDVLVAGRRVPGDGLPGVITTQAWGPDNRSLVYMDDNGHAVIVDTVTGAQRDLGVGHEPTWSPAGDEIAVQLPRERGTERGKRNDGDYYIIPVNRPGEREVLLENPRPTWASLWRPDYATVGYYGAALWSPDGKYLAVRRAKGDAWDTYLLERRTQRIERLSDVFKGDSWGGKP